jgi:hypothetical protein
MSDSNYNLLRIMAERWNAHDIEHFYGLRRERRCHAVAVHQHRTRRPVRVGGGVVLPDYRRKNRRVLAIRRRGSPTLTHSA